MKNARKLSCELITTLDGPAYSPNFSTVKSFYHPPHFPTSNELPVYCPIHFQPLSKDEFGTLDFEVMSHAFACHTALGQLADEQIYKGDFASRLSQAGFQTQVEEVVGTILPMTRDGNFLGNQRFHLIDSDSAFRITAFSDDFLLYLRHLKRLLIHSPLSIMHHVNITIDKITFTSITRS